MAKQAEMKDTPQSSAFRCKVPRQEFNELEIRRDSDIRAPEDAASAMIEPSLNTPIGQALVYCRVSTNHLAEGTSLESQRAACVAHALKLGYTVARVTEEVFSGAELFTRPKLMRDRADIRTGLFQALIVYAVDRLSRNSAHLEILSEEFRRSGCRLIFITRDCNSRAADESQPTLSDEAYAAEVERQKTIERTSRGRRAKLMRGRPVLGGWDLYGYRADRQAGVYLVYEPEAAVVRRIFSWYRGGRGMHSIASTLNREGLPSPKSDRLPGAKWTSSTISRLLNTRSYMGEEYCWKTKRGQDKRDLPRPESEWVRLPEGVRPSIISRELWHICQEMIRARASEMKRKNEPRPALLRGHIFCGECGARMIRNHFKRGKYEYEKYRCGSRWRPFKTDCRGEGVTLTAINQWVWEKVKSILVDPRKIERALSEMERAGIDHPLIADLEAAKRALESTERALHVLTRSRDASASDPNLRPYMIREVGRTTREKQQLERMIAEIEVRIEEARRRVTDLRYLSDFCASVSGDLSHFTFEQQCLALRALGVKVRANGDDPTRWHYAVSIPVD